MLGYEYSSLFTSTEKKKSEMIRYVAFGSFRISGKIVASCLYSMFSLCSLRLFVTKCLVWEFFLYAQFACVRVWDL